MNNMKRISAGQKAIDFKTRDMFGNALRLGDFEGKRLMLSFYRYASCPLCNLRVHELMKALPQLTANGLELIAIFQSPAETLSEYVGRQDAPFAIIPDPEMGLYRQYGVETSWAGMALGMLNLPRVFKAMVNGFGPGKFDGPKNRIPADFLIAPDSTVEIAYYGKDIGDHLPLAEIEAWLRDGA